MPIVMKDQTYYRTAEVCKMVGLGRSTLLRWFRSGIIKDTSHMDRRGWRLFTEADIKRIEDEAHKVKSKKISQSEDI
jgi:predicted site-specific integrase-resolvase